MLVRFNDTVFTTVMVFLRKSVVVRAFRLAVRIAVGPA